MSSLSLPPGDGDDNDDDGDDNDGDTLPYILIDPKLLFLPPITNLLPVCRLCGPEESKDVRSQGRRGASQQDG